MIAAWSAIPAASAALTAPTDSGLLPERAKETSRVFLSGDMNSVVVLAVRGSTERATIKAADNVHTINLGGIAAGLTALLQCSWVYAYIGQSVTARYADEVAVSPYRSWFGAYTSDEYLKSNREWIEWLDGETKGIGEEETENLCKIFETCAGYENRFWDALYM